MGVLPQEKRLVVCSLLCKENGLHYSTGEGEQQWTWGKSWVVMGQVTGANQE